MAMFVDRLHRSPTIIAFVLVALFLLSLTPLRAEEPSSTSTNAKPAPQAAETPLAQQLIGAWTRRAVPLGPATNDEGTEFKFFSGKYWIVIHRDPKGYVVYAHGGTYDLVRDKYDEKIAFSTLYNTGMIGQVFKFKIAIEENVYWQIGLDNDYTEKWNRASGGGESKIARALIGAWTRTANVFENAPQAKCVQYKFCADKDWIAVDTNRSGLALAAHGGTYDLDGNDYSEKTTYSSDFTTYPLGKTSKSKLVLKGGSLVLTGIDSQLAETWTRAE